MADDWYKAVAGHQRVSNIDGHGVNESYKMPSAHPSGRENLSYMHPHVRPLNLMQPWQSVDKALNEAGRPLGQIGRSKTVFPVNQQKARGVPHPPGFAGASRSSSHSPAPGVVARPSKASPF